MYILVKFSACSIFGLNLNMLWCVCVCFFFPLTLLGDATQQEMQEFADIIKLIDLTTFHPVDDITKKCMGKLINDIHPNEYGSLKRNMRQIIFNRNTILSNLQVASRKSEKAVWKRCTERIDEYWRILRNNIKLYQEKQEKLKIIIDTLKVTQKIRKPNQSERDFDKVLAHDRQLRAKRRTTLEADCVRLKRREENWETQLDYSKNLKIDFHCDSLERFKTYYVEPLEEELKKHIDDVKTFDKIYHCYMYDKTKRVISNKINACFVDEPLYDGLKRSLCRAILVQNTFSSKLHVLSNKTEKVVFNRFQKRIETFSSSSLNITVETLKKKFHCDEFNRFRSYYIEEVKLQLGNSDDLQGRVIDALFDPELKLDEYAKELQVLFQKTSVHAKVRGVCNLTYSRERKAFDVGRLMKVHIRVHMHDSLGQRIDLGERNQRIGNGGWSVCLSKVTSEEIDSDNVASEPLKSSTQVGINRCPQRVPLHNQLSKSEIRSLNGLEKKAYECLGVKMNTFFFFFYCVCVCFFSNSK